MERALNVESQHLSLYIYSMKKISTGLLIAMTPTACLILCYGLHMGCLTESSQHCYEAEVIWRNTIIIFELYEGREAKSTYMGHHVGTEEGRGNFNERNIGQI